MPSNVGASPEKPNRLSLSFRFSLLLIVVIALSFGLYSIWSYQLQRAAIERIALAEARVLKNEMGAIWGYINESQNRINYDADGQYHFKGIYCTLAGKNIAQRFMQTMEYDIGFVRESPRSAGDVPDDFEKTALAAFAGGGTSEYHSIQYVDGRRSLRYVAPLRVEGECLSCHGRPAGEIDVTGFVKEGYQLGDVGGAVSITIPLDIYSSGSVGGSLFNFGFFIGVVLLIIVTMRIALQYWVLRPLRVLEDAAQEMGRGDFDPNREGPAAASREIANLSDEFYRMARNLIALQKDLENQIQMRLSELVHANEQLERTNGKLSEESAFKTNFLAIVSHELKAPLASIAAITEIWEKIGDRDLQDIERLVKETRLNCKSMLDMIDNIVDTARIESGYFEISEEDVDLTDVIGGVIELAQPLAEKRNIKLTFTIGQGIPIIRSDQGALHKILTNLVNNAVKYTDSGGAVHVDASLCTNTQQVCVSVRDNGIGIPKKNLERIFQRYIQLGETSTRRQGGSGLGLSLVKELAQTIGCQVGVESTIGVGSEFSIVIPIGDARQ